ncbi:sorting nexin-19-like [Lytechinus variegatus]|uniref:sorting nexin-19-like n=1 Tax=Lytechinus variegatus TaxID=7654 RepID=UPI001BB1EE74|nr:sorting nexin-19-like [Lytechinus variegatus]
MEIIRRIVARMKLLRRYMISTNTRQRMVALICCVFLVHLLALTFGQTLIFMCGTALGVFCAVKLREKPSVVQWESVIPFLPHVAKDRDLLQIDSEKDKGDDRNTVNGACEELKETIQPIRTTFQNEINKYVRLMLRDFVVEWYRLLSDDDQFSHNVFLHFKDMIKNIQSRFLKIDQRTFLCILLRELQAHIDIYRRLQTSRSRLASKSSKLGRIAKKHSVVSIYETFATLHPALQNEDTEKDHLSQLSNALILSLLPSDVIHCDTLVFLLQDILINNVLQPLVNLISEPDFLNEAFILLMIDEPLGEGKQNSSESLVKQEPTHTTEIKCEIESKCDKDLQDNRPRIDMESPDIAVSPSTADSWDLGQNASTSTHGQNSLLDTEVNLQHSPDNSGDEKTEVEKPTPSPFEVIEPQQQFSFPMPMTMLEPSKAISRQADEKASKEDELDQTFGELDFPNFEPIVKVKSHRRSASTGSNVLAIQTPVSQSVGSFHDHKGNDASFQTPRNEGMRSCFSAECLTELEDSVLTSQGTLPHMGQSFQSASSLSSSCEISFSSMQDEPDTDGHPVNAEADIGLGSPQRTSPSHRYPLIRSETAPELLHPAPDILDDSNGSEIPLEWATWRVINLNIPTTSWLGDPKGKKPVVYFIIKYDLLKKPTLSDEMKPAYSSKDEMEVRRRYREFVNLHTRITNSHHLRRNMTGIGSIPKQSMLPISRLSPAMEEQKRSSLETYLKQLLSRPVIHNSREMAEFLAIDGDGHIEFVKKTTSKPLRIDKLLINQVSGIVGTIKTILPERPVMMRPFQPQPPTASSLVTSARVDPPKQMMQSYEQSGPMTEETEVSRQHLEGEDQLDLGVAVDASRIRLFGLDDLKESHVQQAMKFLISEKHSQFSQHAPSGNDPPREYSKVLLGPRSEGDGSDAPNEPHHEGSKLKKDQERSEVNVEVYDAIFGVISEALLNQQSFILDKDLRGTLKILIGDLIDKWLLQEVELLFTEAQWGYYLSLLRDLLWPGDVFHPKERETKTPDEINQTKADALHELTHNPAAAVLSVILGEDHLREGISLVLDSLQDQALNKHLLFTFLDHAMDQLVPEIHDAKFQDLLAAMP